MIFIWTPTLLILPLLCHLGGGYKVVSHMREQDPMTIPSRTLPPKVSCLLKLPSLRCTVSCSLQILTTFSLLIHCVSPLLEGPSPFLTPICLPISSPISLPSYDMPNLPLPPMTLTISLPLESVADSESDSPPSQSWTEILWHPNLPLS